MVGIDDMQLTANFKLSEFIRSSKASVLGITNNPSNAEIANIKLLCENILQPARNAIGPLTITSGYRSSVLNAVVGGSSPSQHETGQSADVVCSDNARLFYYIRQYLPFDQLIWEYGTDISPDWVHVSYSARNRRQVLRKRKGVSSYELM